MPVTGRPHSIFRSTRSPFRARISLAAFLLAIPLAAAADPISSPTAVPTLAQVTPLPPGIDTDNPPPPRLPEATIDDARGRQIPLDFTFVNEDGRTVQLQDYFDGKRPVVLQLGYYACPDLCGLVQNAMFRSFENISLVPGEDYQIVSISIDPRETPQLALEKQVAYANRSQNAQALADGWAMLVSPDESQVERLARELGFGYRYVKQSDRYGHAAGIYIMSPDGLVTRVIYGIGDTADKGYNPSTVRLSLIEASQGQVGTPLDRVLLTCFRWDQASGRFTLFAFGLLKWVSGIFLIIVASIVGLAWSSERKRSRRLAELIEAEAQSEATDASAFERDDESQPMSLDAESHPNDHPVDEPQGDPAPSADASNTPVGSA